MTAPELFLFYWKKLLWVKVFSDDELVKKIFIRKVKRWQSEPVYEEKISKFLKHLRNL